jgi:hypothetical protein
MRTPLFRRTGALMDAEGLCHCGKNPAADEHPCPYAEDVGNDSETLCDCCADCEHQCAMDI